MKDLIQNKKNTWAPALVLVALIVGTLLFGSSYWLRIITLATLYAYWSSSWNIIGGYAGQFSLGHAVFVGIGAYVTGILYTEFGITPWIGMIFGGLLAGILGLIIGLPCFKLKGSYFVLSTVAVLFIVRTVMKSVKVILGVNIGGGAGYKVKWGGTLLDMQSTDNRVSLLIIFALLAMLLFISAWLRRSKLGYYLFAISNDQDAAASLGVNVMNSKLLAMFISAFFTAVGGGFFAMFNQYMDPDVVFAYSMCISIMLFAVVGGSGTLLGPVFGAYIMFPLNEMLRTWLGTSLAGISYVIYGFALMMIVIFLPKGIYGTIENIFITRRIRRTHMLGTEENEENQDSDTVGIRLEDTHE